MQQGDLDGLCGAYSIVNATCLLVYGKATTLNNMGRNIFRKTIFKLVLNSNNPDCVVDGLTVQQLLHSIQNVVAFVRTNFGKILSVTNIQVPKNKAHVKSLLEQKLEQKSAIIIGVSGTIEHWTVVVGVGQKCLHLLDSSPQKLIYYTNMYQGDDVKTKETKYKIEEMLQFSIQ